MSRFLCMALVLGLAGQQTAWAGKDAKDKKSPEGLKIEGKLSADDPRDALLKKSPHRVHEYKMQAGKVYVIDLSSKDFDSVLRLEDAKKTQLAVNDDAEEGTLDSRILFKAKSDGNYRIIATNLDAKEGAYVLTVRPGTEDDVKKAEDIAKKAAEIAKEREEIAKKAFVDLIGKPAPDITSVFSFNGTTKKLSDLKGNVVLLDFWAVWCGPCISTFPHLRELEKEFKKEGLEIVGATTYFKSIGFDKEAGSIKKLDEPQDEKAENEMLKEFVGHHKLNYRIITLSPESWKETGAAYKIRGIPHVALIDRKGILRMVRVGASPENAAAIHEEIRKLVMEK